MRPMQPVVIDKRFCGPANSANGGYACGLLAGAVEGSAEVTLRAPPPLGRPLQLARTSDGTAELRDGATVLGTARGAHLEVTDVPTASFAEAEDASRRSPYAGSDHKLPSCFVCGPARAAGDGLRIFVGPVAAGSGRKAGTLAAAWVPSAGLAGDDGRVRSEFVWAALDCPSGFACVAATQLGIDELPLLGRMSARVDARPRAGDRCVLTAWPIGRDGRKLFAGSALLGPEGEVLAVAQATWLIVDRGVLLGKR
jgi:hypothetical protein